MAKLPLAQLERLSYIDFRLYFLGELRRTDLIDRFETGPAGATRDIAMYKSVASGNLDFDGSERVYRPTQVFLPVFDHQPLRVLAALSEGFGQGVADEVPLLRCETVSRLSLPSMQVLAPISRAIHRRRAVRILYHSLSSGPSEREIVPFALFVN